MCPPISTTTKIKIIIVNASIWTGEALEHASAMAVYEDGLIACVGSAEQVEKLEQPGTAILDIKGRHIAPGLHDPHIHMLRGGQSLGMPDIASAASIAELKAVVKEACGDGGHWVYSLGWDETLWGGEQPHKSWLDEVCPDRPVLLVRMCSHKVIVNGEAARIAGLTKESPDVDGGKIYRDSSGDFTGLLAENAMDIVASKLPKPSLEEKRHHIIQASNYLLSKGITSTHDMGGLPTNEAEAYENLEHVYRHLASQGKLPVRVFAFMPLTSWARTVEYVKVNGGADPTSHVFWGGLKEFADGSLGSSTALFHQPYEVEQPPTSGIRNIPTAELESMVEQADLACMQVAIHAIGDLAVDEVLDVFERVEIKNGGARNCTRPRHRMEHSQHHADSSTAGRIAKAEVHVVGNPLHLLPDKRVLDERLGTERAQRSFAYNSMIKAGVRLAFASDWPVVKSEPLLGIFAAAFRRNPGEPSSFVDAERLSLQDSLRATTLGAAALAGLEEKVGSLRAGKMADFVVLDADPLQMKEDGSGIPLVLQTFVDGECRYGCDKVL